MARTLESALQNRPLADFAPCARGQRGIDYTWGMEFFSLFILIVLAVQVLNRRGQRERTALLAQYLQPYNIEQAMEQLTTAYMRALDEKDPERQHQIWQLQAPVETRLAEDFVSFAASFARLPPPKARTPKVAIPYLEKLLPQASFDMRRALAIHAEGIGHAVRNTSLPEKDRAFLILAEMLLMQHTCHWFCRSRTVASARMLARHQTPFDKTLASVSANTRKQYLQLITGPALGA